MPKATGCGKSVARIPCERKCEPSWSGCKPEKKAEKVAGCGLTVCAVPPSPILPTGGVSICMCGKTNFVANGLPGVAGATGNTGSFIGAGSAASGVGLTGTSIAGLLGSTLLNFIPAILPTNGSTFTGTTYAAAVAGVYAYSAVVSVNDPNTGTGATYTVALLDNGVTGGSATSSVAPLDSNDTTTLSGLIELAAGDQVSVQVTNLGADTPIFMSPAQFSIWQVDAPH